jgi:hypothetical protein
MGALFALALALATVRTQNEVVMAPVAVTTTPIVGIGAATVAIMHDVFIVVVQLKLAVGTPIFGFPASRHSFPEWRTTRGLNDVAV